MSEETGLIVATDLNAVEVFTGPQGVEKILADIEAKVAAFAPDLSTVSGRKAIASLAYKVSQSKVVLDDLGKGLVADWKTKSAAVDAARKIARDRLDALRDKARQPLTEWEEAEAARIAAERLAQEIEEAHADALMAHALYLKAKELESREAELARIEAERLAKEEAEREATRQKEEAERLERERKEREERIAREAAERARREAEEAAARAVAEAERKEREAREAAERAERDRIASEARAKAEQDAAVKAAEERARVEAERIERDRLAKEAAAAAEQKRLADEAAKKAADVEHRHKVNQEALAGLVAAGMTEAKAKEIIKAIAGGLVPHISVKY